MARHPSRHPTELELEILKILWREKSATVRDVRDALAEFRDLAYTSVMTVMNIMAKKKYVRRSKRGGKYVYYPHTSQQVIVTGMLRDLVDRVFDGSAAAAMLHFVETGDIDEEELDNLRQVLQRKVEGQS